MPAPPRPEHAQVWTHRDPWDSAAWYSSQGSSADTYTRFGEDCRGGAWSWVPVVGCNWLAGAREARNMAARTAEDWLTGVKYLIRVGREDGLYAALSEYGQGAIYATAVSTEWTVEQVSDLLDMVQGRAEAYATARAETDAAAVGVPNGEAIIAQTRDTSAYEAMYSSATEGLAKLRDLLATSGPAATTWAQQLQQEIVFSGYAEARFGLAWAPATVALGAIAGTALTLYATLQWLETKEIEATARLLAEKEAAGLIDRGTTAAHLQSVGERERSQAGLTNAIEAAAKAIPWLVVAAGLFLVAPYLGTAATAVGGIYRQLAGRSTASAGAMARRR